MHKGLTITADWQDPSRRSFEIVERKGIGHPDTLADGIADAVSIAYARHCLREFGAVLHHNLDKVYIGSGHFTCGFGWSKMHSPVRVALNGRMSSSFGGTRIDIERIQEENARQYLSLCLPHLDPSQLIVSPNATQYTQRDRWFTPADLSDLPELQALRANDTSLCVAHAPYTPCEKLTIGLEHSLWRWEGNNLIGPLFPDVGQDVKVMAHRQDHQVNVVVNIPLLSNVSESQNNYLGRVQEVEKYLQGQAELLMAEDSLDVKVQVNPLLSGGYRIYLLATGSCIECGEEGLVGRGNGFSGIISACRSHSVEAPYGKNPVYHTGRVLSHLIHRLAWAIYRAFQMPCSIYALTIHQGSLLPPEQLIVELPSLVDESAIWTLVEQELIREDYLELILKRPATLNPAATAAKED